MIFFLTNQVALNRKIKSKISKLGVVAKFHRFADVDDLLPIFENISNARALIVDSQYAAILPTPVWHAILDNIAHRVPTLVLAVNDPPPEEMTPLLTWVSQPTLDDILDFVKTVHFAADKVRSQAAIPIFNPMLPNNLLKTNGFLSALIIDVTAFRRIAVEYGGEIYSRLQHTLQTILMDIWGAPGCIRLTDLLCRLSPESNTYLVFLQEPRSGTNLPLPTELERLAQRVTAQIETRLWTELAKPTLDHILAAFIRLVPSFAVGFATTLDKPWMSAQEIVEDLIGHARENSKIQAQRKAIHQQDLMQAMVHSTNFLHAHYQAVFDMRTLDEAAVRQIQGSGSIRALESHIYAFESLIRVNRTAMEEALHKIEVIVDTKFLSPDVIFAIAHNLDLTLELDQACFRHALNRFAGLPGRLMANILPRNFYHIERLKHLIPPGTSITFEVSETEVISNLKLLLQARDGLSTKQFGIAIDDFGTGYSGLSRVLSLKPDIIKFDRSLISNIHNDKAKLAFVEGLLKAADLTGSLVLAEGVELIEEFVVLKNLGVDLVQGFLLHRPQGPDDILHDLQTLQDLDTVA